MKMIRAIVRPEKVEEVVDSLEKEGFVALTKLNVFGRGKQKGIQIGPTKYDELPKVMLMLVVEDGDVEKVVDTPHIQCGCLTVISVSSCRWR
ncbi:hypothetical protein DRN97_09960 [Methanosarcinales archaeon]|nr:MAG: hypothetical protein DRN97_09960 [Methanosarcinales archaeon]